jgi:hypothetical protein
MQNASAQSRPVDDFVDDIPVATTGKAPRNGRRFSQAWKKSGEQVPPTVAPEPPYQDPGTATEDGQCMGKPPAYYWRIEDRDARQECLQRAFGAGRYYVKKVEGKGWLCFRLSNGDGPSVHVAPRPDDAPPRFPLPDYLADACKMAERYMTVALTIVKEKGNTRLQAKIGNALTGIEQVLADGGAR